MSSMNDDEVRTLCARVNRLVLENEPETFEQLKQLAEEGNPRARYCLAVNYGVDILATEYGMAWAFEDTVKNPWEFYTTGQEYLEFLFICADKGIKETEAEFAKLDDVEICIILDFISPKFKYATKCIAERFETIPENRRASAFKFLKEAVNNEFTCAYDRMAYCMVDGICTEFNLEGAKEMHQKAVEAGAVVPELEVESKIAAKEQEINEVMATATASIAVNPEKAHEMLKEAVEKGSQQAKELMDAEYYYQLALAYREGKGVVKAAPTAYKYFKQAAKMEHLQALYEMGVCIAEGRGTYKNWEKGLAVIQQAAEAGNEDAINYINQKDKFWNKVKRIF